MMTRPLIALGARLRASFMSAIGPSYSSPWLPPVNTRVGPSPRFTLMTGRCTAPQPDSFRECGTLS